MNQKLLLAIATTAGIAAGTTTAVAAPLPAGTLLRIAPTTDPAGITSCTNGSCFGMFLTEGSSSEPFLYFWSPLVPGTDGGIVIGKAQLSGGQDTDPLSTRDGELSALWNYGSNPGTFFTAPDSTGNIFDSASCAGAACIGKTEIKTLNVAWGGKIVPMGSATGCNVTLFSNCTVDQQNGIFVKSWTVTPIPGSATLDGAAFTLEYNQVVKQEFPNFPFSLILRGTLSTGMVIDTAPTARNINLNVNYETQLTWTPVVTNASGGCRIGTAPTHGVATVASDCSTGTYTPMYNFVGTDTFTYIASGFVDSVPATVTATIVNFLPTPTPTARNVNLSGNDGVSLIWRPAVAYAPGGCRIGTAPTYGVATVASDCSTGTYTANIGFVGTDSFTYIGSSGFGDSAPATVTASITPLRPGSPLPAGTILRITPTTNPFGITPCTNGSCFGIFSISSPVYFWTPLAPGTDGGIVLGKPQLSGGQETDILSTRDGELSAKWIYGGNTGTFFTAPDSTGNIFDSASCAGLDCLGKTELRTLNMAWGGKIIPMGSSTGCNVTVHSNCTLDQQNGIFVKSWTVTPLPGSTTLDGAAFTLEYNQVMKQEFYTPFSLLLRGTISLPQNNAPIVTTSPSNLTGYYATPIPFTLTVTDPDGPAAPLCRVGTAPANGTVVLTGCTGGAYTSNEGFLGTDSFTIVANDSLLDSAPVTVNVATLLMSPTPTPTAPAGMTPSPTPTTTPAIPTCADKYPLSQVSVPGKRGNITITFTGHIVSSSNKSIKICPTTTLDYTATTNTPGATIKCKVKHNRTTGSGTLKVNHELKCSDKPIGNDKVEVKVRSGVNNKS